MSFRSLASLLAATALLSAAAGVAQAADLKGKALDFTVRTDSSSVVPFSGRTMKWDARRGRWGLTLDMQQLDSRESTLNDVKAGAYYRITPSLRVGGAVALGGEQLNTGPQKLAPDAGQPRVQLGTVFKF